MSAPEFVELTGQARKNACDLIYQAMIFGDRDGVKVRLAVDVEDPDFDGAVIPIEIECDSTLSEIGVAGWPLQLRIPVSDLHARVHRIHNSTFSLECVANDLRRRDSARTLLTQPAYDRQETAKNMRDELDVIGNTCEGLLRDCHDLTNWRGAIPASAVIFGRAWRIAAASA